MRPIHNLILVVVMTLAGSSIAAADEPTPGEGLDSQTLAIVGDLHLDQAFETAMARAGSKSLFTIGGPSSMLCQGGASMDGAETCVVSAPARGNVFPAALAHR